MKGECRILLLAGALLAGAPAVAGTLYRCTGSDGVVAYASRPAAGGQCRALAIPPPPPAPPAAAVADHATGRSVGPPPPARAPATAPAPSARDAPATGRGRTVHGKVYSYVRDGVRHYASRPPEAGTGAVRTLAYSYVEQCHACGNPGLDFARVRLHHGAYRAEIAAAAREFGVEEAVVRAVIHAESAFNPLAVSRAGAQGLMQLVPATARRFGVADSFDVVQNIRGGVQYLAWLLRRFNGDLVLAAAGYNAGEGAVARHGGVPPYPETRRYVERVGLLAERYRREGSPR